VRTLCSCGRARRRPFAARGSTGSPSLATYSSRFSVLCVCGGARRFPRIDSAANCLMLTGEGPEEEHTRVGVEALCLLGDGTRFGVGEEKEESDQESGVVTLQGVLEESLSFRSSRWMWLSSGGGPWKP
jgi:hypothetical protein